MSLTTKTYSFLTNHLNIKLQQNINKKENTLKNICIRFKENEANRFASELLIPSKSIKSATYNHLLQFQKGPLTKATEISGLYDVSIITAMRKIAQLNDDIAICIGTNLKTKKIDLLTYSKSFKEYKKGLYIEKYSIVPEKTIAYELLNDNRKHEGQKNIWSPDKWFINFYGSENAKLYEWSYKIGNYILTFLALEDLSLYDMDY